MEQTKTLGEYQLIKCLGQGALGTVYLAEHQYMKRQYALKILPEELSGNRTFIQRFQEDIHLLAELEHPHIVKVHNISYAEGKYFLVMDCIVDEVGETTNLSQYIAGRGKPLQEKEIIPLLRQVAEALDYAHKKGGSGAGLVHRNLKPSNILVGHGPQGIHLYLSDFGLTRIIGAGAVLARTYKSVADALGIGWMVGQGGTEQDRYPMSEPEEKKLSSLHISFVQNHSFFAPEQRRFASVITSKADIYAFGVLVYSLFMNDYPEGFFSAIADRHPSVQYRWDDLLRQCLQRDPEKRPGILGLLLEEIQRKKERKNSSPSGKVSHPLAESVVQKPSKKEAVLVGVQEAARPTFSGEALSSLRPLLHTSMIDRPETDLDPAAALQVDPTVKQYQPQAPEVQHLEPIQSEMVVAKGGRFTRGSNDGNRDEMPQHEVFVANFAIEIHPVTNEQFVRFLEVMGGEKDSNHQDIIRLRDSRVKRRGGKLIVESGYTKHPVVGVTWYGAVAYAKWVGKRLPYETEWEIAAAGGDHHLRYPVGDDIERTQANFFSSDTTAVMSYKPNPIGLYDMAGNVYEWCQDWYSYNYYQVSAQEPDNPKGPLQGVYRVLRGGCWKSLQEDLRCSRRHRNNPGTVNSTYGFRCATDVEGEA